MVWSAVVQTSAAFMTCTFGTNEYIKVTEGLAQADLAGTGNDATTSTSSASPTTGDLVTSAAILKGNTLYHYRSINYSGMALVNSADASAFRAQLTANTIPLNDAGTFFSTAVRQNIYGVAVLSYDEIAMPSLANIVSALDKIDAWWPDGRKSIPAELL
jgi:hypothetical protein